MSTLNLGIVAHVDAGKTSLTERLLHAAGVIDEIGRVDDGSTQTDTLALERARGITIRSAVVSFEIGGVTVNLIDTPGHPDFIAEVERALGVLDGAVLVVSAVEGVQAQTRVLMRTLRRLRIPTMIFVNKIDRRGARPAELRVDLAEKLGIDVYPMGVVLDAGTAGARFRRDSSASDDELVRSQTAQILVHPVFSGSAITGAGVPELITGLTTLLPIRHPHPDGAVAGTVFKIDRSPAGEKIAYVALSSGTLRVRERLPGTHRSATGPGEDGTRINGTKINGTKIDGTKIDGDKIDGDKITSIEVFEAGGRTERRELVAGRIGTLHGLRNARIGDQVGAGFGSTPPAFGPPTLETVVVADRAEDRGRLAVALQQLAEQDPLIATDQRDVRSDERRPELRVALYGEVQKEVLQATLAADFDVPVSFRTTTPACVERLAGCGAAVEPLGADGNPFLATVGLRVEPAPPGAGIGYRLEVELGSMPAAFMRSVEETVRETTRQGIHGWPIPDATVVYTHSGYAARQSHSHGTFDKSMSSTGGDFRYLTQLVLAAAVRQAGTQVCEPVLRFSLELPADALPAVLPVVSKLGGVPFAPEPIGRSLLLDGHLPAARVHDLTRRLPGLTHGEGVLETTFDHYAPVTSGPVPERTRTDDNPYDREEFLRSVSQRVAVRRG